jgi:hypothetical protein
MSRSTYSRRSACPSWSAAAAAAPGAVADRCDARVCIVAIADQHIVGKREAGASVGIVVVEGDRCALGNAGQAVGVVPDIAGVDRAPALRCHRHRLASPTVVVGIPDRSLRRGLGAEPIELIVGTGDGSRVESTALVSRSPVSQV